MSESKGEGYLDKSPNAGRIGKAVEHLVAASCILASEAELNVSTSLVDDEGVDLVFHRRGGTSTLAVQVKSRGSDTSEVRRGRFAANVRSATFKVRPDLYMLFLVVDRPTAQLGPVWFIPSADFDELANTTGKGMRRIAANMGPAADDRWLPYRMSFESLPHRILGVLDGFETQVNQPGP